MSANIERFYGFKTMSPFEWWYTPLVGLLSVLIDNNPALITDQRLLTTSMLWGQYEVFNQKYRIHFNHHFDPYRDKNKLLSPNWREVPLRKFSAHVNRVWEYFTELNDERNNIIFFRMAHTLDVAAAKHIVCEACPQDLILLSELLKSIFYKCQIRLVLVDYPKLNLDFMGRYDFLSPDKSIHFIEPQHESVPDWKGPKDRWDAALSSLPFRKAP